MLLHSLYQIIFLFQDKKHGGQSGMVSCIAVHPTQLGTYAVGSYSRSSKFVFSFRKLFSCLQLRHVGLVCDFICSFLFFAMD